MSDYTLGIDLGPNSIGWALVDEKAGCLLNAGVRVFPEGVDRDQQGGELSKNETRRTARGTRRQIARRARRKKRLLKQLVEAGLFPSDPGEQEKLFSADPYQLRLRALTERLSIHEFGRVLIHLNQRRGFLLNRKSDRVKKKETSDMLKEISELANRIESGGHQTLGEYLAVFQEESRQSSARGLPEKIRGKHTRRDMYEREFALLWQRQQQYHPDLLTDDLRQKIHDTIFHQRPLHPVAKLVGRCELERGERRCPRADRQAQRFRLFQEVNNLRLLDMTTGEERPLEERERRTLLEYLATGKEKSFDDIREKLGFFESCKFNFEDAKRTKLQGMQTDAILANKNLFGKHWYDFPEPRKNEIVETLLEEQDPKALIEKAVGEWCVTPEVAEKLADVDLPAGYMNFSRKAIEKLLPHLERGLPLMAGDNSPSAMTEAGYLRPDQRRSKPLGFLPRPPQDIPNPIVRQALHEVRGLVNAIIREYGKPARIQIELAREVKGSLRSREEILKTNRERERERKEAAQKIEEEGHKPTRDAIERYRLWEEQTHICIYSGRTISLAQVLGGEVDVDHILPYARSLDNSYANKVLCFRSANAEKKDRTPYEWLAESDAARYDEILQRAQKLPYNKRRKFSRKDVELDHFIARQLVDTAYISRKVAEYVRCLGADVVCTKGQLTAELRHFWGLDNILNPAWEGYEKCRDDHRHHAVDAIVIALTDRSRLQQLAAVRRYTRDPLQRMLPPPWDNFRDDVEKAVNAINVSHRVRRKVSGALHEETIYGPTKQEGVFVYRKPVESLTTSMIEDIRDPSIREIIVRRLREHGIDPSAKQKISAAVWKEPLTMPSGVPIKKVRLLRKDKTVQRIRNGDAAAYIKPGSNHHVCIFEMPDGKRDAIFTTMLEAARRTRDGEPIIRREHPTCPEAKFLRSLSANEMVIIENGGKKELCRFETAAATSRQMWFRHHTFSGKSSDKRGQISRMPNSFEGRKVTVDRLGRIRWAND
ncbi:MAG TPA: type II CRISPR RNA-guided endonuclease Cas9 [bacterium]|nr:type II CRISPR RNA-guided endonuclease Cas9 [bacterium]HQL63512.1 type II CRISPR RNA-guided endonuclease Cas9 [bacterium]